MVKNSKILFVLLGVCFFALAASAQQDEKNEEDLRKETLSFEDELIEGSAQQPELFYLLEKKRVDYKRLIRLRRNFLPEMRKDGGNKYLYKDF